MCISSYFYQPDHAFGNFLANPFVLVWARLNNAPHKARLNCFLIFFFKFQFLHGEHGRWCTVAYQAINPKEPMTPEESSVFNLFARLRYSFYNVKNGVLNQRVMIETLTVHFQCRGVEKILKFKVEPCKES